MVRRTTTKRPLHHNDQLGGPYDPVSTSGCSNKLDVEVPDSMDFEIHEAMNRIRKDVGGDMANFVFERLGYSTKDDLCNALAAEQIDAVGAAIYQIEMKNQSLILGDQTGIGKGRVAASMIRYGFNMGYIPVFVTASDNLFSDLYRDLAAIGSPGLVPFMTNNTTKARIIDDSTGELIYNLPEDWEKSEAYGTGALPDGYDVVLTTYSQYADPKKSSVRMEFLRSLAPNALFVLDESHKAGGNSNNGLFFQDILPLGQCMFASATFAKRADNLPLYAKKTALSDVSLDDDSLIAAIQKGGEALQEVISANLVEMGQMVRRQRSFDGIDVRYITLDSVGQENYGVPDKEDVHREISDRITRFMRNIQDFQDKYIYPAVKQVDDNVSQGNAQAKAGDPVGASLPSYFSKITMVFNQVLFALKAQAVGERAVEHLRAGIKPVIAFSGTMESFMNQLRENDEGQIGDTISADFFKVLQAGLNNAFKYTIKTAGKTQNIQEYLNLADLPAAAVNDYNKLFQEMEEIGTGISISPIDVVEKIIKDAGFSFEEITGRKVQLEFSSQDDYTVGTMQKRKKPKSNVAFRRFNTNEVDALLLNSSGATGASAHAMDVKDNKGNYIVSGDEVKQRVMLILQPELEINTEVQKRGRINRTGQKRLPFYEYINSAIPAERRVMMVLQKKLRSLDANTASNQRNTDDSSQAEDFVNKYGDHIVTKFLIENQDFNSMLGDPGGIESEDNGKDGSDIQGIAYKAVRNVAILPVEKQESFFDTVTTRYASHIEELKNQGKYDLEVVTKKLDADLKESEIESVGVVPDSKFGGHAYLNRYECNVLKRPYSYEDVLTMINGELNERSQAQYQQEVINEANNHFNTVKENKIQGIQQEMEEELADRLAEEDKANEEEFRDKREAIKNSLHNKYDRKLRRELERITEQERKFKRLAQFFYPGRGVKDDSLGGGDATSYGVFYRFEFDANAPNPYAPSSYRLHILYADNNSYAKIAGSNEAIDTIFASSQDLRQEQPPERLPDPESVQPREIDPARLAFQDEDGQQDALSGLSGPESATVKGIDVRVEMTRQGDWLIKTPKFQPYIQKVKAIPGSKWMPQEKGWKVPFEYEDSIKQLLIEHFEVVDSDFDHRRFIQTRFDEARNTGDSPDQSPLFDGSNDQGPGGDQGPSEPIIPGVNEPEDVNVESTGLELPDVHPSEAYEVQRFIAMVNLRDHEDALSFVNMLVRDRQAGVIGDFLGVNSLQQDVGKADDYPNQDALIQAIIGRVEMALAAHNDRRGGNTSFNPDATPTDPTGAPADTAPGPTSSDGPSSAYSGTILNQWATLIEDSSATRQMRYIITGNLLQATPKYDNGQLIDFTLLNGGKKKGILMPVKWKPEDQQRNGIVVPINKAAPAILNLSRESSIPTVALNSIGRLPSGAWRYTVKANGKNKPQYTDTILLEIAGDFQQSGNDMIVTISDENVLQRFLERLYEQFTVQVVLSPAQFEAYKDSMGIEEPDNEEGTKYSDIIEAVAEYIALK